MITTGGIGPLTVGRRKKMPKNAPNAYGGGKKRVQNATTPDPTTQADSKTSKDIHFARLGRKKRFGPTRKPKNSRYGTPI
jgi:hypothetical protein